VSGLLLYAVILLGGLLFGVGWCVNWRAKETLSVLGVSLMVLGAAWTGGVAQAIEHEYRPVTVVVVRSAAKP